MRLRAVVLAALVNIQPIVSEDVLEPSVRNEVDHALSLAVESQRAKGPRLQDGRRIIAGQRITAANHGRRIIAANCGGESQDGRRIIATASSTNCMAGVSLTNTFGFVASPANAVPADVFGTNGLSATAIAIKLVSSQRADGRWLSGTNDVTDVAIQILLSL